jgi:hypothetical protein
MGELFSLITLICCLSGSLYAIGSNWGDRNRHRDLSVRKAGRTNQKFYRIGWLQRTSAVIDGRQKIFAPRLCFEDNIRHQAAFLNMRSPRCVRAPGRRDLRRLGQVFPRNEELKENCNEGSRHHDI